MSAQFGPPLRRRAEALPQQGKDDREIAFGPVDLVFRFLGRHRADRRIGDNGDSVSFRISPCPFCETGTEDAGGQNDWAGMARIAVSELTDPARTRTAQPHARLVAASGLLRHPRDLGGELDLIIHPVTAQ